MPRVAELGPEHLCAYGGASLHVDGVFQAVGQLAHIARPPIGHKELHGPRGNAGDLLAQPCGVSGVEPAGQWRDVLFALPEGRDDQRDNVEAVKQVLPEFPPGYHGPQVAVGSTDDTDVQWSRPRAAQGFDAPLFQHPEQFDLKVHRHVTDLVEE